MIPGTRLRVYPWAIVACLAMSTTVLHAQLQPSRHGVAGVRDSATVLARRASARDSTRDSTATSAPPQAAAAFGTLIGSVTDSLHDTPLADASVTIVQLPRKSAITSNTGAFKIDSIPPGRYTLEILHPVLDSLRIRVVSDTVDVTAGATQATTLGVPSGATLVASLCSPLQRKVGPAVIVGQVLDADANTPVVGAEVSVAWLETAVDAHAGVQTVPRVRKATTTEGGLYRICGVPASLHGTLQAIHGDAETGEVDLAMTDVPVLLRFLRLSTTQPVIVHDTTQPQPLRSGPGVVTGRVTNRGGVPLKGVRVLVTGSTARAVTTSDGSFALNGVPLGTQAVEVHSLGYASTHVAVDVATHGPNTLAIQLATLPPALPAVEVKTKAKESQLAKVGFDHRRKMGFGKFLTEDDIEKAQPVLTSDVLRLINGLHVVGDGSSLTVVSSRGETCVQYMIDRHYVNPQAGLSIDELVNPTDIVGLEFYQANDVPMEFDNPQISGCGLLVVWTRAQLKPNPKPQ